MSNKIPRILSRHRFIPTRFVALFALVVCLLDSAHLVAEPQGVPNVQGQSGMSGQSGQSDQSGQPEKKGVAGWEDAERRAINRGQKARELVKDKMDDVGEAAKSFVEEECSNGKCKPYPVCAVASVSQWEADSQYVVDDRNKFTEIFSPMRVSNSCPFCYKPELRIWLSESECPVVDNQGEIWEYWWPEGEVEIHNFGISFVRPEEEWGASQYARETLIDGLKNYEPEAKDHVREFAEKAGLVAPKKKTIPDMADEIPLGYTKDETHPMFTQVADVVAQNKPDGESHYWPRAELIRTPWGDYCLELPFYWNGYDMKYYEQTSHNVGIEKCFYDTGPQPRDVPVHGWTEEEKLVPYWRNPFKSADVMASWYDPMVPPSPKKIKEALIWLQEEHCPSFRLTADWRTPESSMNQFAGLERIGIKKRSQDPNDDILRWMCYRQSRLYPIADPMPKSWAGNFRSAVAGRKGIELISRRQQPDKRDRNILPLFADSTEEDFKTNYDKLQRVNPLYDKEKESGTTKAWGMPELDEENVKLFPVDETEFFLRAKQSALEKFKTDSKRYIYWNKRVACTCPFRGLNSPFNSTPIPILTAMATAGADVGWGCMPYDCNPDSMKGEMCAQMRTGNDIDIGDGNYDASSEYAKVYGTKDENVAKSAWQVYPFDEEDQRQIKNRTQCKDEDQDRPET